MLKCKKENLEQSVLGLQLKSKIEIQPGNKSRRALQKLCAPMSYILHNGMEGPPEGGYCPVSPLLCRYHDAMWEATLRSHSKCIPAPPTAPGVRSASASCVSLNSYWLLVLKFYIHGFALAVEWGIAMGLATCDCWHIGHSWFSVSRSTWEVEECLCKLCWTVMSSVYRIEAKAGVDRTHWCDVSKPLPTE